MGDLIGKQGVEISYEKDSITHLKALNSFKKIDLIVM